MQALADRFGSSPELNVLHIMGLFDRPARAKEINWLRTREKVPDLTDKIRWLINDDWNRVITNLRHFRLIAPESHHNKGGLDAHPHVREHFGKQLKEINEESFKQGHSHLYEFLKMSAPRLPDTLEEMEPLFAAVTHGCLAGQHQETFSDVYDSRIQRGGNINYCCSHLGAIGADLAVLSGFFEKVWSRPVSELRDSTKGVVLNYAGDDLRSLGRLTEAAELEESATDIAENQNNWVNVAIATGDLSLLYMTLGDVAKSVDYARKSFEFSERADDIYAKMYGYGYLGYALHEAGELSNSEDYFRKLESIQAKSQPEYTYLYSAQGFEFCDLLLSQGDYKEVQKRAKQTIKIAQQYLGKGLSLWDIGLDMLSLGRAYLLEAVAETRGRMTDDGGERTVDGRQTTDDRGRKKGLAKAEDFFNRAIDGLREAGTQHYISRGLLARAELYRYQRNWERAWGDLEVAWEIAERGQMNLYMADYHLEAARLCLIEGNKEKEAREHYEEAKKRVDDMGYHRRDPEVLLIQAELEIVEGDKKSARQTLEKTKKRIDEMGCHRWDSEVERLENLKCRM